MDWITLAFGVGAAGIVWLVNYVLEKKSEQKQAANSSTVSNDIDDLYEED